MSIRQRRGSPRRKRRAGPKSGGAQRRCGTSCASRLRTMRGIGQRRERLIAKPVCWTAQTISLPKRWSYSRKTRGSPIFTRGWRGAETPANPDGAEKLWTDFPDFWCGWIEFADALSAAGRTADAEARRRQAMQRFPTEFWPNFWVAWQDARNCDAAGAVEIWSQLVQRFPGQPAAVTASR